MTQSVFLGMRGTGDWPAGYRPENYRENILRIYPNGKAPLTAIMAMLKSEKVNDPHFHWFEKGLPDRSATPTAVYSGANISGSLYAPVGAGTAVAGDAITFQMAAADAQKFIAGNEVYIRVSTNLSIGCIAKVGTPVIAGASSYVPTVLLEADDNGGSVGNIGSADTVFVVGNIQSEGSGAPGGQRFDAGDVYNYTQIFKNALENTRTAMQTKLRTGDDVKEAKREALELHSIDLEMAFIFGIRSLRAGANNKPERTTAGIKAFIATNKWNVLDETSGFKWLTDGENWLSDRLEEIFKYGSENKLMLCGSGVLTAIDKLIRNSARCQYALTANTTSYGIKVFDLISPHGVLSLKSHPLFSVQPTLRYSGLTIDAQNIRYRFMQDTTYQANLQDNDVDGEKSQYLTEAGLELWFENTFSWIDNMGSDVP